MIELNGISVETALAVFVGAQEAHGRQEVGDNARIYFMKAVEALEARLQDLRVPEQASSADSETTDYRLAIDVKQHIARLERASALYRRYIEVLSHQPV